MASEDVTTKTCKQCGNEYPATVEYFYKGGTGNRYLLGKCRNCKNGYYLERYHARMESEPEYRELRAQYNESTRTDPDKKARKRAAERKRYKERYDSDPEYRARLSDKRVRHYREGMKDPDYRARKLASSNKRRALKVKAGGAHSARDIRLQLKSQKGLCWWCGESLDNGYHTDHRIALDRGGSNDARNICISCPKCNLSKRNKLPHEWIGRLL